jgi:hypothetical protein
MITEALKPLTKAVLKAFCIRVPRSCSSCGNRQYRSPNQGRICDREDGGVKKIDKLNPLGR